MEKYARSRPPVMLPHRSKNSLRDGILRQFEEAIPSATTPICDKNSGAPRTFTLELVSAIPSLYKYARKICKEPNYTEDLVQETLLKAWLHRDSFRVGTSLLAWTRVILRNVWLDQLRKSRFVGTYSEAEADQLLAMPPDQEKRMLLFQVGQLLDTLPTQRREALLLVCAEGLSYEEAASRCGCATGTIKSRISRTRKTLNAMMS